MFTHTTGAALSRNCIAVNCSASRKPAPDALCSRTSGAGWCELARPVRGFLQNSLVQFFFSVLAVPMLLDRMLGREPAEYLMKPLVISQELIAAASIEPESSQRSAADESVRIWKNVTQDRLINACTPNLNPSPNPSTA